MIQRSPAFGSHMKTSQPQTANAMNTHSDESYHYDPVTFRTAAIRAKNRFYCGDPAQIPTTYDSHMVATISINHET